MKFDPSTARATATFSGFDLTIPVLFQADSYQALVDQLTAQSVKPEIASGILQQIFMENSRNNVANEIKKKILDKALSTAVLANPTAYVEPEGDKPPMAKQNEAGEFVFIWSGKVGEIHSDLASKLSAEQTEAAQAVADVYFTSYQLGVPRSYSSSERLDPTLAEAIDWLSKQTWAGWKASDAPTWRDLDGTSHKGLKSVDRPGSSHAAANAMLTAGQRPTFMLEAVFARADAPIASVREYVEAKAKLTLSPALEESQMEELVTQYPHLYPSVEILKQREKTRLALAAKEMKNATKRLDAIRLAAANSKEVETAPVF